MWIRARLFSTLLFRVDAASTDDTRVETQTNLLRKREAVSTDNVGHDRVLGHALEIIPVSNPVVPMGSGRELTIRVLFRGEPLPKARVSFIPRHITLKADFDEEYERRTDDRGDATFTPQTGDQYLVVTHHKLPEEAAVEYDAISYSATLNVFVPQVCSGCVD